MDNIFNDGATMIKECKCNTYVSCLVLNCDCKPQKICNCDFYATMTEVYNFGRKAMQEKDPRFIHIPGEDDNNEVTLNV